MVWIILHFDRWAVDRGIKGDRICPLVRRYKFPGHTDIVLPQFFGK